VIKGWRIFANELAPAITLKNTQSYVRIESNDLLGPVNAPGSSCLTVPCITTDPCQYAGCSTVAVRLSNVSHVVIEEVRITNVTVGVEATDARDFVVLKSQFLAPESDLETPALLGPRGAAGLRLANVTGEVLRNSFSGFRGSIPDGVAVDAVFSSVAIAANTVTDGSLGFVTRASEVRIEANEFSAVANAFFANSGTVGDFSTNMVNASDVAVCGDGTAVTIARNRFLDAVVLADADNPFCPNPSLSVDISDNEFTHSSVLLTSNGTLHNNTFDGGAPILSDLAVAVFSQWYGAHVTDNLIHDVDVGMAVRGATSYLSGNAIHDVRYGVIAYGQNLGVPLKPTMRNNSIERTSLWSLFATDEASFSATAPASASSTDARWNWWGSPGGPGAAIFGSADYEPWLTSPP
jgi:hypothetical protein